MFCFCVTLLLVALSLCAQYDADGSFSSKNWPRVKSIGNIQKNIDKKFRVNWNLTFNFSELMTPVISGLQIILIYPPNHFDLQLLIV